MTRFIPKPALALFVLLLGIGLLMSSSYSWFTSRDVVDNHFAFAQLNTYLHEVFEPPSAWLPDTPTQKEVSVFNSGKSAAFVRLSLQEYALLYQIGQDGTPKTTHLGEKVVADLQQPESWTAAGNLAVQAVRRDENGVSAMQDEQGLLYYTVQKVLQSQNFNNESGRDALLMQYIRIGWSEALGQDWLFHEQDGYFYYLKPLPSGQRSSLLIEQVMLSGEYPFTFQFAPYCLRVQKEGILASLDALQSVWQIPQDSPIYLALQKTV